MTTTTFHIDALPATIADAVRSGGPDASGRPAERWTAGGGEPLRCCLRDAVAGDELLLFGYEPPIPASPYREIGAVFVHAEPCAGPEATDRYPEDWRKRTQVFRAYDERGWIHGSSRMYDGDDPEGVIAEMLDVPEVAQIHTRNIAYGCFMLVITRGG